MNKSLHKIMLTCGEWCVQNERMKKNTAKREDSWSKRVAEANKYLTKEEKAFIDATVRRFSEAAKKARR